MSIPIIAVNNLQKSFQRDTSQELLVLDDVNFQINEGEIVALLGKSGSGKSTLLRTIAGLIKPSNGEVFYSGELITKPVDGVAMVFQNFALLPWLTVLQNVELGLEALGVPRTERRARALKAIDTIGLDGFESAFPKELSGGMRQRVGFARAIVVNPTVLLMDEPFSALDVLTAENLRSDLLDLWQSNKTNTKAILFVTHNIEEAVKIADRIIIFASDPGTIRAELRADMPHPRNENSPEYRKIVDDIYRIMTTEEEEELLAGLHVGAEAKVIELGYRLPDVAVSELVGMLETLASEEHAGKMDLPELAEELHMDVDDLLPITDILEILRLVDVSEGDITLTPAGIPLAEADILERKSLFANQLIEHIPLIRHIREQLDSVHNHRQSENEFLNILEKSLSEKEATRVLKVAIDWGRYAEIFAYDVTSGILSLENPQ